MPADDDERNERRPGGRCWTAVAGPGRGCTPCPPSDGALRRDPRTPPAGTPAELGRGRRLPTDGAALRRPAARHRRPRGTSRRSSRSRRRVTGRAARSSPCTTAPSRRRPGSASASRRSTRADGGLAGGRRRGQGGRGRARPAAAPSRSSCRPPASTAASHAVARSTAPPPPGSASLPSRRACPAGRAGCQSAGAGRAGCRPGGPVSWRGVSGRGGRGAWPGPPRGCASPSASLRRSRT